jgi:acetylornithine deacetylase/succinyl-diaminopimelate desuccinylase-like protein
MILFLTASVIGCITLFAAAPDANVGTLSRDAVGVLQEYVRVDTTNPPGNETRGVAFLAKILDAAGIVYETVESAPGRGNIWARLEGGDEPAILLLHHIDVVPADKKHWTADPLGAEIRDGYIYGRGTLDTKTSGVLHLQAFLALHASDRPLNRDVIFMATADEEAGGHFGAGWLAKNKPELFEGVGVILNEGGGGTILGTAEAGTPAAGAINFEVEVTQKVPWWFRLVATDEPGHGSMPRATNAVTRIVHALAKLDDYEFEPRIVPAVDAYFKAIVPVVDEDWREPFANIGEAVTHPGFLQRLQLDNPFLHALTRNACSITMLEGSSKINVVPPSASAQIDCRLVPDQDPQAFIELLRSIINDQSIEVETIMGFTPAVSSTDTDVFRAIESVTSKHFPGSRVIPAVLTGFTDSHFFRDMGITAYGFEATVVPTAEQGRVHGNDERMSVENVKRGVRMTYEILESVVYD